MTLLDLLSLTQLHTASLEDHAKHLTKRVDGLRSLISSAKATGAVKKLLPTAVTGQHHSPVSLSAILQSAMNYFARFRHEA